MSIASLASNPLPPDSGDAGRQRDQAYARLRKLLILEQLPQGSRLCESDWSSRLSVNRSALREAFARLEAEGLIQKGPKTGYFVPTLTENDAAEIAEVRRILEAGAIERICRLGLNTPANLKRMKQACDQLERLVREDYLIGAADADRRFHEAMVDASGSNRLRMMYQRAPLPTVHPRILHGPDWLARIQRTLEEHRAILAALLTGDAAAGQEVLRLHLRR